MWDTDSKWLTYGQHSKGRSETAETQLRRGGREGDAEKKARGPLSKSHGEGRTTF